MDSQADNFVTLNNGLKMPKFGLGTMGIKEDGPIKAAVQDMGYRLLDCASRYRNEEVVGKAINDVVNVEKTHKREDLYVISKVWWDEVEDCEAACKKQLEKLQVDYLDLYLVHWPIAVNQVSPSDEGGKTEWHRIKQPMHKTWEQMEALVDKGLVKSIGVSNFNVQLLWDLLNYCRIKPVCNEIELSPYCAQV